MSRVFDTGGSAPASGLSFFLAVSLLVAVLRHGVSNKTWICDSSILMTSGDNVECLIFMMFLSPMCCSYIQLKLEPLLFPTHLFTMEQIHYESDSSKRFRIKMHQYAARYQVLVEATFAREAVRHTEWLRLRNEQRDLIRATGSQQKRGHQGQMNAKSTSLVAFVAVKLFFISGFHFKDAYVRGDATKHFCMWRPAF